MVTHRQKRAIKQLKNIRKQKKKFPEFLTELIKNSDIILEVLDARFVEETRNKEIEQFIQNKKNIMIHINKMSTIFIRISIKIRISNRYIMASNRY